MLVNFTCPRCQHGCQGEAGQKSMCENCGQRIQTPFPPQQVEPLRNAVPDESPIIPPTPASLLFAVGAIGCILIECWSHTYLAIFPLIIAATLAVMGIFLGGVRHEIIGGSLCCVIVVAVLIFGLCNAAEKQRLYYEAMKASQQIQQNQDQFKKPW